MNRLLRILIFPKLVPVGGVDGQVPDENQDDFEDPAVLRALVNGPDDLQGRRRVVRRQRFLAQDFLNENGN